MARHEDNITTTNSEQKTSFWKKLQTKLTSTSTYLVSNLIELCTTKKLDSSILLSLEAVLLRADFGPQMTARVIDKLKNERFKLDISVNELQHVIANEIENILQPLACPIEIRDNAKPHIILMVGVNGTGKTTTIGKLANLFSNDEKSVMLCAGDTFRAAAVKQLEIWSKRSCMTTLLTSEKAGAASVAFDAIKAAKNSSTDVLIIDTAGRLQNSEALIAELDKIVRVTRKQDSSAPHNVILTLDATIGQNSLDQVDIFKRQVGVTGLIMTKLDGSARGGALVAIGLKHKLPIHFIGVGEGIEDLAQFNAQEFARAITGVIPQEKDR